MKTCGLFIFTLISLFSRATPQQPDILYFNGDTLRLYDSPLETEFPELEQLILERASSFSSDCWRGYIAEWTILNDSLFLLSAKDCIRGESINDLIEQVCGPFVEGKIFAHWVSTEMFSTPEAFTYFFCEREVNFVVEDGILAEVIEFNQLHPESELMSERQIEDTVFNNLDMASLFPSDSFTPLICRGTVKLDSRGNMVEVEISEEYNQQFGNQVKAILESKEHWTVGFYYGKIVVSDIEFLLVFREEDYKSISER
ncbi:MAG: hypothetical protein HWE14_07010 [Flavobacteriia bacterium]|nr:hypothetical protein [Flavobacteriia bacterium]